MLERIKVIEVIIHIKGRGVETLAFVWQRQIIPKSTIINKADMIEIKDNAQYVIDNHCPSNYMSDRSNYADDSGDRGNNGDDSYRSNDSYDSSDNSICSNYGDDSDYGANNDKFIPVRRG